MGASGENGRKNPTRCGRTMSPLQVASSCSHAGFYSVVSRTAVANSSFLCTRNNHIGWPEQFYVVLKTWLNKLILCVHKLKFNSKQN